MTKIYDTNNGVTYNSVTAAVRGTGCKSTDIKFDCDRFHDNNKIIPRFIYLNDMNEYIEPIKEW